jgi:hypothetical protein
MTAMTSIRRILPRSRRQVLLSRTAALGVGVVVGARMPYHALVTRRMV